MEGLDPQQQEKVRRLMGMGFSEADSIQAILARGAGVPAPTPAAATAGSQYDSTFQHRPAAAAAPVPAASLPSYSDTSVNHTHTTAAGNRNQALPPYSQTGSGKFSVQSVAMAPAPTSLPAPLPAPAPAPTFRAAAQPASVSFAPDIPGTETSSPGGIPPRLKSYGAGEYGAALKGDLGSVPAIGAPQSSTGPAAPSYGDTARSAQPAGLPSYQSTSSPPVQSALPQYRNTALPAPAPVASSALPSYDSAHERRPGSDKQGAGNEYVAALTPPPAAVAQAPAPNPSRVIASSIPASDFAVKWLAPGDGRGHGRRLVGATVVVSADGVTILADGQEPAMISYADISSLDTSAMQLKLHTHAAATYEFSTQDSSQIVAALRSHFPSLPHPVESSTHQPSVRSVGQGVAQPQTVAASAGSVPPYAKPWSELSIEHRRAAVTLGYEQQTWDDEKNLLMAASLSPSNEDMASSPLNTNSSAQWSESQWSDSPVTRTRSDSSAADADEPALDVRIVRTEMSQITPKKQRMFYVIQVKRKGQPGYTEVRKRYSQFESLRKLLTQHSKLYKALNFPKKKRIKGHRGSKQEDVVAVREKELQYWLRMVVRISTSSADLQAVNPLALIEQWIDSIDEDDDEDGPFPPGSTAWSHQRRQEAMAEAFAGQHGGGSMGAEGRATAEAQAREAAELEAAIAASMGEQTPQASLASHSPPTTSTHVAVAQPSSPPQENEAAAEAAVRGAIEMGFAPDKVRSVQQQQTAAVGKGYESTEDLVQALLSVG